MRHSHLRAGPGAILLILAAAAGPWGRALAAEPPVASVEIRGNSRTSSDDIATMLGVKVGDTWSPRTVADGVRRLYKRGLFRDVVTYADAETDGIHLRVQVVEKPLVKGVELEGARKVKKSDLQEVLTLGAGSLWDEGAALEDRDALAGKLKDKGYHRAEITSVVDTLADGRYFLHWHVKEGEKTKVKGVEFTGNQHVSSEDLRGVMETRKRHWFSGGDFKQETFDTDLGKIVDRMKAAGYLDAKVTDHQMRYDAEGGLILVITVEEGRQYRAGALEFTGNHEIATDSLAARLELARGNIFDESKFQESVEGLYDAYGERGYVYCTIDPQRKVSGDSVNVLFRIDEGEPAHVGKIDISGNLGTKERVVRRELTLVPGDLFRRSALMRSHREIYSLGFFEDVQVKTKVSPTTPDIDLTFDVKEKQTGQFMAGASYSGEFGLVGNVEMAKTNFRGTGETVSIKGDFGRIGQLDLSFTEPWFRGTPTSVGVDVFDTRLTHDAYTEKSRGAALRVGRPLRWLDYSHVYLRYRWEKWKVIGTQTFIPSIAFGTTTVEPTVLNYSGEGNASAIQGVFTRNSTDSPFFPTHGSALRMTSEFSGGILGGNTGYQSHVLDDQFFFPVGGKMAFSLTMRAGAISTYRGGQVPVFEKFRLGGIGPDGVRGYPDLDIVPAGNDPADGGRAELILRAEHKFPITGPQLFGLFFFDAGNVWNSAGEVEPSSLKRGAGLGFRVEIPGMGTLGFDYGYGFDRTPAEGGPGWELHFNIGSASLF